MAKKKPWTEARVFPLLRHVFPSPTFVLLPQVRNCTGFSRRVRTADALAVSTWPSRGLWFAGVEIKVSLADWRRELADPPKAESIGRYCRYWYVAAPKGVVPIGELPEAWGLVECTATSARIEKPAEKQEEEPPGIKFTASILRKVDDVMVPRAEVQPQIRAARREGEESGKLVAGYEAKHLQKAIDRFEQASGLKIEAEWKAGELGEAVRHVLDSKQLQLMGHARGLLARSEAFSEALKKLLETGGKE